MKEKLLIPVLSAALVCTNAMPVLAEQEDRFTCNDVAEDDTLEEGQFNTNLEFPELPESYTLVDGGLNGKGSGDRFYYSDTEADNFIYEADVKFNEARGAASLVFRADKGAYSYVANLQGDNGKTRIFKFGDPVDLVPENYVETTDDGVYHLKLVAIDKHIVFYVNDQMVGNTADYTLCNGHYGQDDALTDGYLGLLTWESDVTYQNVKYTPITEENTPELSDLSIESIGGKVDKQVSFYKGQYVYIAYVSGGTEAVKINAESLNDSKVKAYDEDENELDLNNIEVTGDQQIITLKSEKDGAQVIYRIKLHHCQDDESYYNEKWRDQFHYSVKDGWANDPNGMVYFKGKWHMYYQYFDDCKWGPMHWAHASSTDRIHWDEHPITVYPDEYGTMYSGSAVVADHETAPDIFKEGEEGIVYFITANGANGNDDQKIIAGYSFDGEKIYKYDKGKVLIHWKEDPLNTSAFRDPKVFRYNNKWFMVVAGGPLRIYSSDNLVDWKCESTYPELHTECPDLFPVIVENEDGEETGEVKWVLSRGGRKYKIGDFKEVDGKYSFIPDEQYKSSNGAGMGNDSKDGVMNFGYDSYAAMTYYKGDFGAEENYNKEVLRDLTAINWMNTWEGSFCNSIPDKNGNTVFNGTFNLQLNMKIVKNDDGLFLVQTPIDAYKKLEDQDKKIELKNVSISENTAINGFNGTSYVLRCHLEPGTCSEVGIKVRKGKKHETVIKYQPKKNKLSIDRAKSGVIINRNMSRVNHTVKANEDGSLDLEVYVDRSSVEVFNNNYTVEGALQIFPDETDDGIALYSDGDAKADIIVCPMKSIWNNAVKPAEDLKPEEPGKESSEKPESQSSNEKIVEKTVSTNGHVVRFSYDSSPAYTGAKLKAADFIKDMTIDGESVKAENIGLRVTGGQKPGSSVKAEINKVKGLDREVNRQLKGLDIAEVRIRPIEVSEITKWKKKYEKEGQIIVKKRRNGLVSKVQVIIPKNGVNSGSKKAKKVTVSRKNYEYDSNTGSLVFDGTILTGSIKL